ncbi:MAG: DUF2127 domain-containing protein [Rudaea sp.]|nr:DUF2127 domain-containing protein [Rudaea sp.]
MADRGPAPTQPATHRALAWIAVFKLFKAAALLTLAAATLHLLEPGALDRQVKRLRELPLAAGWQPMMHAIDWLTQLSQRKIAVAAALACAYALLYAIEGVGLWLRKRWAEYLTTVATATLIPFEIWELTRSVSLLKVAALAINVAIVIYLYRVIRSDRKAG